MITSITSKTRHHAPNRSLILRSRRNATEWLWHVISLAPAFVLFTGGLIPDRMGWLISFLRALRTDNGVIGFLMTLSMLFMLWMAWFATTQGIRAVLDRKFRRGCRIKWASMRPYLVSLGLRYPRTSLVGTGILMLATLLLMVTISVVHGLLVTYLGWDAWAGDPRSFSSSHALHQTLIIILAVIYAPAMEEFVIRGMLLRFLIMGAAVPSWRNLSIFGRHLVTLRTSFRGMGTSNKGMWVAIILSGVIFGVIHPPGTAILAGSIGMLFGFLAIATGSLYPGMIIHVMWNLMAIIMAISS